MGQLQQSRQSRFHLPVKICHIIEYPLISKIDNFGKERQIRFWLLLSCKLLGRQFDVASTSDKRPASLEDKLWNRKHPNVYRLFFIGEMVLDRCQKEIDCSRDRLMVVFECRQVFDLGCRNR